MGKLRLNCPNCGKAVAVSETAKKARCPGCKKVMDVAAALAGDIDPSTELAAGQEAGAAGADASAPAGDEPDVAKDGADENAEEDGEVAEPKRSSSRVAGKSGRKSGRKSGQTKAVEGDGAPPPTFDLPGGAQPWMIIAGVAAVAALVLWLVANVNPIAAIGIVSALGLFVDSALMRVTRVSPSGKGWGPMPMVWGFIGFAPVVGVAIYVLLRRKLVESSPEDIATPDMDEDDMSFEGKVRPPSVVSVGMVVVLALAIGSGMFFQLRPSCELDVGTSYSQKNNLLDGQNERRVYNIGELFAKFYAKEPLADYEGLKFDVAKVSADGTGESIASGDVKAIDIEHPYEGAFTFEVKKSGRHRLLVKDASGTVYATYRFRVAKGSR